MAASWVVISGLQHSLVSQQAPTEAPPTLNTDGLLLADVASIVPVLTAPPGETFTGSGTLQGYIFSDSIGLWLRAPRSDDTLADMAGLAQGALPAIQITSGNGRFAWICNGVGLSGGAIVTLTLICASLRGGGVI